MSPLALALMFCAGDVGPGPVVSSEWARCPDGGYADLRPDIPVMVVTDSLPEDVSSSFEAAFVLYADGRVVARRGLGMVEWRLNAARMADLLNRIGADQLLGLEPVHERLSDRHREAMRRSHFFVPETWVGLWKYGCRAATVRVRGLSLLGAASAVGRPVVRRLPPEMSEHDRWALASLPSPLSHALRVVLTLVPPGDAKVLCRGAGCFVEAPVLRHHEFWDGTGDPLTP